MNQSLMLKFVNILVCLLFFYPTLTIAEPVNIKKIQNYIKKNGFKWKVIENPDYNLRNSQRHLNRGLIIPPEALNYSKLNMKKSNKSLGAPVSIDWRALSGVSEIKDQGYCGSCWAFALVGNLESAFLINPSIGISTDLSEQQLIDCNSYGMGCGGGWFDAADVWINYGSVSESNIPYLAYHSSCNQDNYVPVGNIENYGYVTLQPPLSADDVENIKLALNAYGPLFTTMQAIGSFSVYGGGLYEVTPGECTYTDIGDLNHAVLLVGYDDTVPTNSGNGVWYIKNSYGESWGDSGFMTAAYGTCQIGSFTGSIINPSMAENHPPEITSGPMIPKTSVIGGEEMYLRVQATDEDAWDSNLEYVWSTTEGCGTFSANSNLTTYTAPDSEAELECQITITVKDQFDEEDSSSGTITVTPNYAPVLTILADKLEGAAPLKVTFAVESTDPNEGDSIDSYEWDFGDGETSTDEICTHTFNQMNTYIVSVTATDSLGKVGIAYASITVNDGSGLSMNSGCGALTNDRDLNKLLFLLLIIPLIILLRRKIH